MPCIHVPGLNAIITVAGEYKPGDPPPKGYLDKFEWAQVQEAAGLKQVRCSSCSLWCYPQEIESTGESTLHDRFGRPRKFKTYRCHECAKNQEGKDARKAD